MDERKSEIRIRNPRSAFEGDFENVIKAVQEFTETCELAHSIERTTWKDTRQDNRGGAKIAYVAIRSLHRFM